MDESLFAISSSEIESSDASHEIRLAKQEGGEETIENFSPNPLKKKTGNMNTCWEIEWNKKDDEIWGDESSMYQWFKYVDIITCNDILRVTIS